MMNMSQKCFKNMIKCISCNSSVNVDLDEIDGSWICRKCLIEWKN